MLRKEVFIKFFPVRMLMNMRLLRMKAQRSLPLNYFIQSCIQVILCVYHFDHILPKFHDVVCVLVPGFSFVYLRALLFQPRLLLQFRPSSIFIFGDIYRF